jgi:hypothetical protein
MSNRKRALPLWPLCMRITVSIWIVVLGSRPVKRRHSGADAHAQMQESDQYDVNSDKRQQCEYQAKVVHGVNYDARTCLSLQKFIEYS